MNLLTFHYWFSTTQESFLPWAEKTVFLAISFLFIAGLFARFWRKKYADQYIRQVFLRVSRLLITLSLTSFIFFFFTSQAIPLLGARFWYLSLFIIGAIWFFIIVRHYKKVAPLLRKKAVERIQFEKYLPKK